METIYPHLSAIHQADDGGYRIDPASQAAVERFLRNHGFTLASLKTHPELLEALRYCNAIDLDATLRKPAPRADLRLLWRRMRRLAGIEQ